jgi:hypothetical protein
MFAELRRGDYGLTWAGGPETRGILVDDVGLDPAA